MKWLRNIIAEEVSKVEGRLTTERGELASFISIHSKAATNLLEAEVLKVVDEVKSEVVKLVNELHQKLLSEASVVVSEQSKLIGELCEKVKALETTASKFSHWRAEPQIVQADQDLQKVK